jgi:hypothetical protein
MKTWRGSNFGARRGWVVNAAPRELYPRKENRYAVVHEGGWAAGPVWTGMENLVPTNICWKNEWKSLLLGLHIDHKHRVPYFSIDNAHLMYNAHPKLFHIPFDV